MLCWLRLKEPEPVHTMKCLLLAAVFALTLLASALESPAADTNQITTDLNAIVAKINDKLKNGQDTEKDLAPNLAEFDTLFAKYKDEKTDAVARILFMKATLYLQVLEKTDAGVALLHQIQKDYPGTKTAEGADAILAAVKRQEEAKKISASLTSGSVFPDFSVKDLAGKPLSIANYKGKVLLIDFWATWCGPCVAELPNVLKTYEQYHGKGFDIIGISLDQDRSKLESFLQRRSMTWPQYFDGQGWGNALALKYGIEAIPATFLLNGEGKIIGKDLRGEDLQQAVSKALSNH
jgi:thiol-disulfide isomerase/thioredoxin